MARALRPAGVALIPLVATLGCSPHDGRPSTRPAADTTASAPPAGAPEPAAAPGDRIDEARARDEALKILESVALARNLRLRGEVEVKVIDKPGIRRFVQDSMYEHETKDELRMHGRIAGSLGVLPAGADLEAIILDLLEDGVLGLYDPKTKTLLIGDFVPNGMLSMVVGHEIAHGLQDMYFDLKGMQEPIRHDSDAESARKMLVEGDAQASYLAWVSGADGVKAIGGSVLDAMGDQALELAGIASPYPMLARELQMPYNDGAATVIRLVQQRDWKAVDDLYADLPRTSEQMLHLEKLLAREPAIPTKLDESAVAAALPGLKPIWHDTMGELALLVMLAETEDSSIARRAAAGWGGDFMLAFDRPDRPLPSPVVTALVAWDTEADAKEFVGLFQRYLETHAAPQTFVERKGARVVFATGVPADVDRRALMGALWRATHVGK